MSDLSYLIQTQNQVVIDQTYLQKCQQQNKASQMKKTLSGLSKNFPSKDIKINKTKTQLELKAKSSLQKSFKNLFSSQNVQQKNSQTSSVTATSEKEEITKISMRIQALQENQKRLQQKIGVDFFQMKESLIKWSKEQNQQIDQVSRIKSDLNGAKKKIGQLLGLIAAKTN